MRLLVAALLLAISIMRPASACPDRGSPSPFWSRPVTSATDGPLLFQKEAVQKAIFDDCFLAGTNVETASRGGVAVEDVRVGGPDSAATGA